MKKPKKRKRLIRGRDYHGWAWKAGKTWVKPGELFCWAETVKPALRPTETGRWVRVRFVEVVP